MKSGPWGRQGRQESVEALWAEMRGERRMGRMLMGRMLMRVGRCGIVWGVLWRKGKEKRRMAGGDHCGEG